MNLDSDCFKCPISREIMTDPVLISDGYSYERNYIHTWILTKGNISPMTRQPIKDNMIPNRALKDVINWYQECEKKIPTCMERELLTKLVEEDNFIVLEKLMSLNFFGDNIEDIAESAVIICLWKNFPITLEILVKHGAVIDKETARPFLYKIKKDYEKLSRLCKITEI